jgi:ATP-dependent protease ClpP protease subunit
MEKECDRDNFLTPEEAIEMGLIDKIITKETNTTGEA